LRLLLLFVMINEIGFKAGKVFGKLCCRIGYVVSI